MEQHGSSYFVIGEGLLGESGGRSRADRCARRPASRPSTPPFRFSRLGPNGTGKPAGRDQSQEDRQPMAVGGGAPGSDPRRLHLPRPVRRPRPHLRQDERDARRRRLAGRSCSRRARRASTSTRSTAPGPADPESAKFYEADGLHLKTGRTVAAGGVAAMDGFDLPRGAGTSDGAEAHGDHPRPAQRREPRRRPDPLRDHPLPQPGRRHAAASRAAGASVPHRPRDRHQHYQWMLRTDYLPRICAPASSTTCSRTAARRSRSGADADRRADDADRVLRRRLPARPLHGARRLQLEQASSTTAAGHARAACSSSRRTSGDLGGRPAAARATGSPTSAASTTSARPAAPTSPCRPNKFNRAMRIDTRLVDPLAHLRRASFGGPARCRSTTRAEPRLPQPDPREDGAGSRPGSRWRAS